MPCSSSSSSTLLASLQFATLCATTAFVVLLHFRVDALEVALPSLMTRPPGGEEHEELEKKKNALELEKKVVKLEAEIQEVKKQHFWLVQRFAQLQQLQQLGGGGSSQASPLNHLDDRRSDMSTDYVNIFGTMTPQPPQYEIATWTNGQVLQWVEKVVGKNESALTVFEPMDGPALLEMLIEDDNHGFSFGDKCFFMGVDRDSCNALERASGELLTMIK